MTVRDSEHYEIEDDCRSGYYTKNVPHEGNITQENYYVSRKKEISAMRVLIGVLFLVGFATSAYAEDLDGRTTVTTAGTAVSLGSGRFDELTVCAEADNTGVIAVGVSPIASLSTRQGVYLNAEDCWTTSRSGDLRTVKIDSTVNGEGVNFYSREK